MTTPNQSNKTPEQEAILMCSVHHMTAEHEDKVCNHCEPIAEALSQKQAVIDEIQDELETARREITCLELDLKTAEEEKECGYCGTDAIENKRLQATIEGLEKEVALYKSEVAFFHLHMNDEKGKIILKLRAQLREANRKSV